MFLKDIRDWLKLQINDTSITCYIGKIDASKEQALCLYGREGSNSKIAVGGLENTSTGNKTISILVHYGKNYDVAERKVKSIYDIFNGQQAVINNHRCFFKMKNDEPIALGANDNGIYEFTIDLNICYEREEVE